MATGMNLVVNLMGNTSNLNNSLQRGATQVALFSRGTNRSLRRLQRNTDNVFTRIAAGARRMAGVLRSTMRMMGQAVVLGTGLALKRTMDFDDAIRAAGARAEATEKGFFELGEKAKDLGRHSSFTATQVANMMKALGQGGFKVPEINQMTKDVMNLAKATGTDAEVSSKLLARSIRIFKLEAADAARVSDVFTTVANSTLASVDELAESWNFAAKPAAELNMTLEETAAVVGSLAQVGVTGSLAGTAIRKLAVMSAAKADDIEKSFGVKLWDRRTNKMKSMVDVMAEIGHATANMGDPEQTKKFFEAFGIRGVLATQALSGEFQATDALLEKIKQGGGVAEETAKQMESGIGGAWRRMMSAIEGVALMIGEVLTPGVTAGFEWIAEKLNSVTDFIKTNWQSMVEFMERMMTILITVWDFTWDNAGDILKMMLTGAMLGIVQFAENFKHFFLTVLPMSVKWFVENFSTLFLDGAAFVGIAMRNLVDNIIELWRAAMDWVANKGFEPDLKPLGEGFEALMRDNLTIPDRIKGSLEKELETMNNDLQQKVGNGLGEAIANNLATLKIDQAARRLQELDDTAKIDPEGKDRDFTGVGEGGTLGAQSKFVGAQTRGSAEALKTILSAGKTDEEAERLRKIAEESLRVQEEQLEIGRQELRRRSNQFNHLLVVLNEDTP